MAAARQAGRRMMRKEHAPPQPGRRDALVQRLRRLEDLVAQVEALPDDRSRTIAVEAIQALLHLHGDGLERMIDLIHTSGPGGPTLVEEAAADQLVSGLLLLHGLHPVSQEERIRRALDSVRPFLRSHGGDVELVSSDDGVVRIRLHGTCDGRPSSPLTLRYAVEQAILEAAPDVGAIDVEDSSAGHFVRLPVVPSTAARWLPVRDLGSLPAEVVRHVDVDGDGLVVCRIENDWFAYEDGCAGCAASLAQATIRDHRLACPKCGARYDLRAAGRCEDASHLRLRARPILEDAGGVRVATR